MSSASCFFLLTLVVKQHSVGCPFSTKEHHTLQIIFTLWVKLLGLSQFSAHFSTSRASLVPQLVENPPAMRETWVLSVGWEDTLEEGMATHSSILAWRILMDRGTWQDTVHGVTKSWTRLSTHTYTFFSLLLVLCLVAQSCLALCDPMDGILPGSSVHEDSPSKNTGVGCHAFL